MPVTSATSRNLGSPKSSLKSASDEVDLQLGHDRQNADFGIQLNSGYTFSRLGKKFRVSLDDEFPKG